MRVSRSGLAVLGTIKVSSIHIALVVLGLFSFTASAQEWISWKDQSTPQAQPPAQQAPSVQKAVLQPIPSDQAQPLLPAATNNDSTALIDKAECDAEVARSYPVFLWAPGLGKKRVELFDACISKRSHPAEAANGSVSITKADCDAEVARTYPVNLWAPGLTKKRQELFAVCVARAPTTPAKPSHTTPNNVECDAEVARTYPVNLWAPGLREKRQELHAACMAR